MSLEIFKGSVISKVLSSVGLADAAPVALVEGVASLALDHAVAAFGGSLEALAIEHKDAIHKIVSDRVLEFVSRLAQDLESAKPAS